MPKSPELFSESARIDIATNFASFDAIDFSSDFPDFIDGDLKVGHFLTLIHEATHHWCLMTPVGTALAARTYRTYHDAAYMAASIPAETPAEHARRAAFDASLIASRTLTNFFVPLLEGLALYAEWRACPDGTGVYSRPFDLFNKFSGARTRSEQSREYLDRLSHELELVGANRIDAILQMKVASPEMQHLAYEGGLSYAMELRQLRAIPSERLRFERMLQSAIDPRRGSYQLGYLFVCALETISGSHGRSDMLLGFLRDHFFNDPVLAALILDEETGIAELYERVRDCLFKKVVALASNPESTARQVEAWGSAVPFAPIARSSADDFLGRTPSSEADPAAELYAERLSAFCTSVGSEIVPETMLEPFLILGRALMPLGSDEFAVTGASDGLVHMSTDKGLQISVKTADFLELPALGTRVRATMLANVMSPGTVVSLQWDEQFEIIAPENDTISKPLIELAYHQAEHISRIVQIGQDAIEHLHRVTPNGREPVEAAADDFLDSDETANHVLEIYRFPIVMAFTADIPRCMDARWRTNAFMAWQPRGVSTLLESPGLLRDFMKVCGMTVALHIGRKDLHELDIVKSTEDLDRIEAELFAVFKGVTQKEYHSIIAAAQSKLESRGARLFCQTQDGEWLSLI